MIFGYTLRSELDDFFRKKPLKTNFAAEISILVRNHFVIKSFASVNICCYFLFISNVIVESFFISYSVKQKLHFTIFLDCVKIKLLLFDKKGEHTKILLW